MTHTCLLFSGLSRLQPGAQPQQPDSTQPLPGPVCRRSCLRAVFSFWGDCGDCGLSHQPAPFPLHKPRMPRPLSARLSGLGSMALSPLTVQGPTRWLLPRPPLRRLLWAGRGGAFLSIACPLMTHPVSETTSPSHTLREARAT